MPKPDRQKNPVKDGGKPVIERILIVIFTAYQNLAGSK